MTWRMAGRRCLGEDRSHDLSRERFRQHQEAGQCPRYREAERYRPFREAGSHLIHRFGGWEVTMLRARKRSRTRSKTRRTRKRGKGAEFSLWMSASQDHRCLKKTFDGEPSIEMRGVPGRLRHLRPEDYLHKIYDKCIDHEYSMMPQGATESSPSLRSSAIATTSAVYHSKGWARNR